MLQAVHDIGSPGARVYSVGGWARSKALLQLRASVLGEPLVTIEEQELTALGAALTARDVVIPGTAMKFQRDTHVTNPDPDWQARYERMFETIRDAIPGNRTYVEGPRAEGDRGR
jgi:xylulokinase